MAVQPSKVHFNVNFGHWSFLALLECFSDILGLCGAWRVTSDSGLISSPACPGPTSTTTHTWYVCAVCCDSAREHMLYFIFYAEHGWHTLLCFWYILVFVMCLFGTVKHSVRQARLQSLETWNGHHLHLSYPSLAVWSATLQHSVSVATSLAWVSICFASYNAFCQLSRPWFDGCIQCIANCASKPLRRRSGLSRIVFLRASPFGCLNRCRGSKESKFEIYPLWALLFPEPPTPACHGPNVTCRYGPLSDLHQEKSWSVLTSFSDLSDTPSGMYARP